MSLFDKVKNKRYNLQERSGDFTDKQQADNVRMLDNLFGTKGKAKKTAKTAKKAVRKSNNPRTRRLIK